MNFNLHSARELCFSFQGLFPKQREIDLRNMLILACDEIESLRQELECSVCADIKEAEREFNEDDWRRVTMQSNHKEIL